jgi:hypothetical protein
MSYQFFGNFHGKHADEVLNEAKKQKQAEDTVYALMNPIGYIAKNGVKFAVGSERAIVSEENFVKALILKTLKEHDLAPNSRFERKVKSLVREVMREEYQGKNPQWEPILPKARRAR